jgi:hypothetical protein
MIPERGIRTLDTHMINQHKMSPITTGLTNKGVNKLTFLRTEIIIKIKIINIILADQIRNLIMARAMITWLERLAISEKSSPTTLHPSRQILHPRKSLS